MKAILFPDLVKEWWMTKTRYNIHPNVLKTIIENIILYDDYTLDMYNRANAAIEKAIKVMLINEDYTTDIASKVRKETKDFGVSVEYKENPKDEMPFFVFSFQMVRIFEFNPRFYKLTTHKYYDPIMKEYEVPERINKLEHYFLDNFDTYFPIAENVVRINEVFSVSKSSAKHYSQKFGSSVHTFINNMLDTIIDKNIQYKLYDTYVTKTTLQSEDRVTELILKILNDGGNTLNQIHREYKICVFQKNL